MYETRFAAKRRRGGGGAENRAQVYDKPPFLARAFHRCSVSIGYNPARSVPFTGLPRAAVGAGARAAPAHQR